MAKRGGYKRYSAELKREASKRSGEGGTTEKDVFEEPEISVRRLARWREGTIAIRDNRCTQHFAVGDFDGRRVIRRVKVMGDSPGAAVPGADVRREKVAATSRYDRQPNEVPERQIEALESYRRK